MPRIKLNGKWVTCPLCDSDQWLNPVRQNTKGQIVAHCAHCRTPVTTYPDY